MHNKNIEVIVTAQENLRAALNFPLIEETR